MKILILSDGIPPEVPGGAEVAAWNMAVGFAELGHEVSIITTSRNRKERLSKIRRGKVDIFTIYTNYNPRWRSYVSLYNYTTTRAVKNIIRKIRPEIIHAHNIHYFLSYYCLKIANLSGAKVFLTAHDVMSFHYGKLTEFIDPANFDVPRSFDYKVSVWQQIKKFRFRFNIFRNIIIKHYLKYVNKIFAVSNALREALDQNGIRNVEVINNGIDLANWSVNQDDVENFKKKYGLKEKKIILFGGRISGTKGGNLVLPFMEAVVKQVPESVLLILGRHDEYVNNLLKDAEKRKMGQKIIATGWLSGNELVAAFYCASTTIVPSVCFDSFPTVVLESMACKKPVVATCFGGSPEMIMDGVSGYVVNPYNIGIMAKKVTELLSDTEKARKFGEAGYEIVNKRFSLKINTENYISHYKKFS